MPHESIINMITDVARSDTAHIMVPAEMTPQPDAARRKSDEDSAVVVQKRPDIISARS